MRPFNKNIVLDKRISPQFSKNPLKERKQLEDYSEVYLHNAYSVKDDDLEFTNFLSNTDGDKKIKEILAKIKIQIEEHKLNIYQFYIKDIKEMKDWDRIIDILKKKYGYNKELKCQDIIRHKFRTEARIQLYGKIENSILHILLIDLFHLGLPADLYTHNNMVKYNRSKIYNAHKHKDYCISKIFNPEKLLEEEIAVSLATEKK